MEMRDNIEVHGLMSDSIYYTSCLESPKTGSKIPLKPHFFPVSIQKVD
jgi:hypothetical protein